MGQQEGTPEPKIEFTNVAEQAIERIVTSVRDDSGAERAEDFARDLEATFIAIAEQPNSGARARPASRLARYVHMIRHDGFLVLYVETEDGVIVTDLIYSWMTGA